MAAMDAKSGTAIALALAQYCNCDLLDNQMFEL
jgi:hypothetical protein